MLGPYRPRSIVDGSLDPWLIVQLKERFNERVDSDVCLVHRSN